MKKRSKASICRDPFERLVKEKRDEILAGLDGQVKQKKNEFFMTLFKRSDFADILKAAQTALDQFVECKREIFVILNTLRGSENIISNEEDDWDEFEEEWFEKLFAPDKDGNKFLIDQYLLINYSPTSVETFKDEIEKKKSDIYDEFEKVFDLLDSKKKEIDKIALLEELGFDVSQIIIEQKKEEVEGINKELLFFKC